MSMHADYDLYRAVAKWRLEEIPLLCCSLVSDTPHGDICSVYFTALSTSVLYHNRGGQLYS